MKLMMVAAYALKVMFEKEIVFIISFLYEIKELWNVLSSYSMSNGYYFRQWLSFDNMMKEFV